MKITLGITNKLIILFFFFICIFFGTILVLFVNVQKILETSEQIVSINNQVANLSKIVLDNLINMEINEKKFRLLKKETYRTYYLTAENFFCDSLDQIIILDSPEHRISDKWKLIRESFKKHTSNPVLLDSSGSIIPWAESIIPWAEESLINSWMEGISTARKENQKQIDLALIKINEIGKKSVKNSFIGLVILILAGFLGAGFIAKSIIKPIKKLKSGIKNISNDNYSHVIKINTNDEFSELAYAFNDMSRQLKENENIRSDFIAALSHEIRTPLSSTQESVKLIIEEILGPINDNQKKFLTIASSEISRINNLLNHLLNVSMLESDSKKITPLPIEANKMIQEVAKGLISIEKINNVKIRLHECKDAPRVMGVKKEIIQVLGNIINNALKFSYKDSFVDVFVLNDKNNSALTFQISDQGPGVPEEDQALIFKRYYRAKSVRNHMDGVGLGLNISKRIIHAHGGIIYMKNNKDRGCSFFFTLPKER
jgi:signal transduction histidine kinase